MTTRKLRARMVKADTRPAKRKRKRRTPSWSPRTRTPSGTQLSFLGFVGEGKGFVEHFGVVFSRPPPLAGIVSLGFAQSIF
jgi:hypothetical protein